MTSGAPYLRVDTRTVSFPELYTSYLHIATPTSNLQTSTPLSLPVATFAARPHTSRARYFCVYIATVRLQSPDVQNSRPPCLHFVTLTSRLPELLTSDAFHVYTPSAPFQSSRALWLQSSRVQRASISPNIQASRRPRLHGYSASLELQSSYSHVATPVSSLYTSMPPYLPVATPAAHPQTSGAPNLHSSTSTCQHRKLHTSIPPRRFACSASPDL